LITDVEINVETGISEYFDVQVVDNELRVVVVATDLSKSHDCGVFGDPVFSAAPYFLTCADGTGETLLEVR
jgi:hypothetical protein